MKAITIPKYGAPDVLEVRTHPDPEPGEREVLVETRACGFNFAELMARQGLYEDAPAPPCVVGYEASGGVKAVGKGVSRFEAGDHVVVSTRFGGHASVLCVDEKQVVSMPDGMTFEQAAAMPVNFLTAYHMILHVAHLRGGERILIHMAAGGVGTAAVQLAETVGDVEIYGTASPSKHDLIRELGCDHPIDYRSEDYEERVRALTDGEGVDVVLDPLGGPDWKKGYRLLRSVGRLVTFGFANMFTGPTKNWLNILYQYIWTPSWDPLQLMEDNKTVSGVNIGHLWDRRDLLREEMDAILELYREGSIAPVIDSSFPFSRADDAHRRMQNRENTGKILLVPDQVYESDGS